MPRETRKRWAISARRAFLVVIGGKDSFPQIHRESFA